MIHIYIKHYIYTHTSLPSIDSIHRSSVGALILRPPDLNPDGRSCLGSGGRS